MKCWICRDRERSKGCVGNTTVGEAVAEVEVVDTSDMVDGLCARRVGVREDVAEGDVDE